MSLLARVLSHAWWGCLSQVPYSSFQRVAVPQVECYCKPDVCLYSGSVDSLSLQQLQGLFPCTGAVTEFMYLAQSKKKQKNKKMLLFLLKHINQCSPFTYRCQILSIWIGG